MVSTKKRAGIRRIRVIGRGWKNHLLNQFTADATGRRALLGPPEAAALGNIGMELLATRAARAKFVP